MRHVQHQFLPVQGTVRIEMKAVVRPDKADYWLEISCTDVAQRTLLWDRMTYFERSEAGIASLFTELHDMMLHLEDHMNVNVPPLTVENPIDTEF